MRPARDDNQVVAAFLTDKIRLWHAADLGSLTNRIEHLPIVIIDDLTGRIKKPAGALRHELPQEYWKFPFSDKAEPGGRFSGRCWKVVLSRNQTHLTFGQVPDWKQHLLKCRVRNLKQQRSSMTSWSLSR